LTGVITKMKTNLYLTILILIAGVASVHAGAPPVNGVPEAGTTIVLLGLGLGAVVAARHKFGSRK
jgi:hypothetical protein